MSTLLLILIIIGVIILGAVTFVVIWMIKNPAARKKIPGIAGQSDGDGSQTIIESIADGVVVINTERKITLINPAACTLTGWPIDEAMGIDVSLVFKFANENGQPVTEDQDPFNVVLKSKDKLQKDVELTDRQGAKKVVSLVISAMLDKTNVTGVVCVIRDVSVQKAAEKQRADFISTASHEMRTPVAAIEGYLSLAMNDKVSNIDAKAREFLEKAHTSTQQLGKLFQDLLTSSRAEDGRLVNHPEVIDMGVFVADLAESFSLAAEKKHLVVEFSVASSDDPTSTTGKLIKPLYFVHVDPERIREVVTNIFDNAVKYTPAGKITIGINGDKDFVHVFVKDTGAGIPSDDIPHLFQKFYRVDNSAVRTIGGTGLGLYICKKIVELYNGNIWVESELGKGSTFHIDLPRLSSQQAEQLKVNETAQKLTGPLPPNLSL